MAANTIDAEADRLRQSERTVDNLKRLYAVLFALSFGQLAQGTIAKINSVQESSQWTFSSAALHVEVTVIFAITAGLFYYQSDRFLDIGFARAPLPKITSTSFAFGYLVNVLTMAPLYFMAYSLGEQSLKPTGFTWYFIGYAILITNGLLWLFLHAAARRIFKLGHQPALTESLTAFWMTMNSLMLLLAVLLFKAYSAYDGLCVAGHIRGAGYTFVALLGGLILVRDIFDFHHGWPILYPVQDPDGEVRRRRILTCLMANQKVRRAAPWVALVLTAAAIFLLIGTGLLYPGALKAACA